MDVELQWVCGCESDVGIVDLSNIKLLILSMFSLNIISMAWTELVDVALSYESRSSPCYQKIVRQIK